MMKQMNAALKIQFTEIENAKGCITISLLGNAKPVLKPVRKTGYLLTETRFSRF